jgi:menaquinone-9 beta-reductase
MIDQDRILYDVAVVGGGLAGLSLAIQLSGQGHQVILFEKEKFPFHKVCGEYISLESWDFLNHLGLDPDRFQVPIITKLELSADSGKVLQRHLPLGGFGISRYLLDNRLAELARDAGVKLLDHTKVNDILFEEDTFRIYSVAGEFRARIACGTFGKRSNIDVRWKRPFIDRTKNRLNNYVGVKYHVHGDFPVDTIALHNFPGGYCGLVKIEADLYNLCYLTTAENLRSCNGNFREMEQTILSTNPLLRRIFGSVRFINEQPHVISQISFDKKTQVENHVLMVGDAAGMITPLCGNGMSMALHGSRIAAAHIHHYLSGHTNRTTMEKRFIFQWQREFSARLRTGRRIQRLFGSRKLTNIILTLLRYFPTAADALIRKTHGKPF